MFKARNFSKYKTNKGDCMNSPLFDVIQDWFDMNDSIY